MMKLRLPGWLFLGVTMALPAAQAAAERTLRVVMLGSQSETLDYGRAQTYYPWVVTGNVCDVLVADKQGSPDYQLSRAITPNQDATRWTVSLRSGVRFSDGSPLTADDALASLRFLATSPGFAGFFSDVDMQASHVVNAEALELVLTRPRADLVTTILTAASMVWKQGRGDAAIPVCSGSYQVTSFNAQNGALLSRNPYAWHPAAWFDRIEIRPLADATARVNALLSGAADYAFDIPVSSARSVDGRQGWQIIRSGVTNASGYYFAMNTRVKPFDDVEVRQALKTLVNRQQLLDVVLGGYGYRGNDVFGQGLSGFDNQTPSAPDRCCRSAGAAAQKRDHAADFADRRSDPRAERRGRTITPAVGRRGHYPQG
ncbi:ABC transporter substrate-binding protein [Klebsiella sp. WOUb02]|uniref:ABC transporter substrate-binding protein n=1 Tax=Klebsiella sp. WOUb02 TaxID=3161071 RepID=UPI003CE89179